MILHVDRVPAQFIIVDKRDVGERFLEHRFEKERRNLTEGFVPLLNVFQEVALLSAEYFWPDIFLLDGDSNKLLKDPQKMGDLLGVVRPLGGAGPWSAIHPNDDHAGWNPLYLA